ncbi:MAG: hypothetical protein ACFFD4_24130, partial [Candidatus Odinarchaeota archaeon]
DGNNSLEFFVLGQRGFPHNILLGFILHFTHSSLSISWMFIFVRPFQVIVPSLGASTGIFHSLLLFRSFISYRAGNVLSLR